MSASRMRFGWLAKLGRTLLWGGGVILLAIVANLVGIRLLGNINAWEGWMTANATIFFIWRLLLYAGIAYGWRRMTKRLRMREPEARARLQRAEIAAVLTFIALEGARFL
jgi:hypothetical protein